jgi:hypothetical protein
VDAQASISIPNAQNIVSQLVDIAKANNAMDVIGTSTSWRWQEGLISRMPKTRTVAAILTKAFRSDDPRVWLSKVPEDLSWFIKVNIIKDKDFDAIAAVEVEDVYETYFLTSWFTGDTSREEIIFGFCYFRYACSIGNKIEVYEEPHVQQILSLFEGWATKKFDDCTFKFDLEGSDREKKENWGQFFNSESFTRMSAKLAILRNKIIGFTSIHDMWRSSSFRVSDEEHIKIELEIISFYKDLRARYANKQNDDSHGSARLRTYAFSALTFPSLERAKI